MYKLFPYHKDSLWDRLSEVGNILDADWSLDFKIKLYYQSKSLTIRGLNEHQAAYRVIQNYTETYGNKNFKKLEIGDLFERLPNKIIIDRNSLDLICEGSEKMINKLKNEKVKTVTAKFTFEHFVHIFGHIKYRVGYSDGMYVYHTLYSCKHDLRLALIELLDLLKEFKILV
jgi:hypothetical protein